MPHRLDHQAYLELIEALAKLLVRAAIDEGSFEVYLDGPKTPLQQAITELARRLRYRHYPGDGCVDDDHEEHA
jgi:hypothetical protein